MTDEEFRILEVLSTADEALSVRRIAGEAGVPSNIVAEIISDLYDQKYVSFQKRYFLREEGRSHFYLEQMSG